MREFRETHRSSGRLTTGHYLVQRLQGIIHFHWSIRKPVQRMTNYIHQQPQSAYSVPVKKKTEYSVKLISDKC